MAGTSFAVRRQINPRISAYSRAHSNRVAGLDRVSEGVQQRFIQKIAAGQVHLNHVDHCTEHLSHSTVMLQPESEPDGIEIPEQELRLASRALLSKKHIESSSSSGDSFRAQVNGDMVGARFQLGTAGVEDAVALNKGGMKMEVEELLVLPWPA